MIKDKLSHILNPNSTKGPPFFNFYFLNILWNCECGHGHGMWTEKKRKEVKGRHKRRKRAWGSMYGVLNHQPINCFFDLFQ